MTPEKTPEELRRRRLALGLRTQVEAAPVFGVGRDAMAKWEEGQRRIPEHVWILLDAYEKGYRPPIWPQERWKRGAKPEEYWPD